MLLEKSYITKNLSKMQNNTLATDYSLYTFGIVGVLLITLFKFQGDDVNTHTAMEMSIERVDSTVCLEEQCEETLHPNSN